MKIIIAAYLVSIPLIRCLPLVTNSPLLSIEVLAACKVVVDSKFDACTFKYVDSFPTQTIYDSALFGTVYRCPYCAELPTQKQKEKTGNGMNINDDISSSVALPVPVNQTVSDFVSSISNMISGPTTNLLQGNNRCVFKNVGIVTVVDCSWGDSCLLGQKNWEVAQCLGKSVDNQSSGKPSKYKGIQRTDIEDDDIQVDSTVTPPSSPPVPTQIAIITAISKTKILAPQSTIPAKPTQSAHLESLISGQLQKDIFRPKLYAVDQINGFDNPTLLPLDVVARQMVPLPPSNILTPPTNPTPPPTNPTTPPTNPTTLPLTNPTPPSILRNDQTTLDSKKQKLAVSDVNLGGNPVNPLTSTVTAQATSFNQQQASSGLLNAGSLASGTQASGISTTGGQTLTGVQTAIGGQAVALGQTTTGEQSIVGGKSSTSSQTIGQTLAGGVALASGLPTGGQVSTGGLTSAVELPNGGLSTAAGQASTGGTIGKQNTEGLPSAGSLPSSGSTSPADEATVSKDIAVTTPKQPITDNQVPGLVSKVVTPAITHQAPVFVQSASTPDTFAPTLAIVTAPIMAPISSSSSITAASIPVVVAPIVQSGLWNKDVSALGNLNQIEPARSANVADVHSSISLGAVSEKTIALTPHQSEVEAEAVKVKDTHINNAIMQWSSSGVADNGTNSTNSLAALMHQASASSSLQLTLSVISVGVVLLNMLFH